MNQYLTAREGMRGLLGVMSNPMQNFKRNRYKDAFEDAYLKIVPVLDSVEELYRIVLEPDTMVEHMAAALTETAKEKIEGEKKGYHRDQALMDLNLTMVVFVFPAILRYAGKSSRPLVDALLVAWKEAFPKTNLQAAEFDYIEKGFHRKFCYITTAVCEALGRGDDCYELELMRDYRDGYLSLMPDGPEQIRHYYDIAPTIVKHIQAEPDSGRIYRSIWDEYLSPCVRMIEAGEKEACRETYIRMVGDLKERYFYI